MKKWLCCKLDCAWNNIFKQTTKWNKCDANLPYIIQAFPRPCKSKYVDAPKKIALLVLSERGGEET